MIYLVIEEVILYCSGCSALLSVVVLFVAEPLGAVSGQDQPQLCSPPHPGGVGQGVNITEIKSYNSRLLTVLLAN